jgi:hypothetical protein
MRHHTVRSGTVSEGGSVPPSLRAAGFEDDDEDEDENEAPCEAGRYQDRLTPFRLLRETELWRWITNG